MRRVVVTGMGIWSCIGQDLQTVTESLRQGRSGIIFDPKRIEYGLRSGLVGNVPRPDLKPLLPRKFRATMSEDTEYAYMAARQAFEQAGISDDYLRQNEVGIIFGCDGGDEIMNAAEIMEQEKDVSMLDAGMLFRSETSSVSMNLSTIFHVRGINLTICAACASSSHTISLATSFIREGMQNMIMVGGCSLLSMRAAPAYDAVEGLSLCNETPTEASKPFDKDRDGIVHSGGAAALLLEDYEHAVARGATIIAEIGGIGMCSTGAEEVSLPTTLVLDNAIERALKDAGMSPDDVDYICPMASSLIYEDEYEAIALSKLFTGKRAYISSTESMTGHENFMAGAAKMVYSILMMQNDFIAPNINFHNPSNAAEKLNIATKTVYTPVHNALVNASGMGGTNCCIIVKKVQ